MKKVIGITAILVSLLLGGFQHSHAGKQDFRVVNMTGVTIWYMYVSASNEDRWGSDVLDNDLLSHGQSVNIRFPNYEYRRYWDLKISDLYGNEYYWRGIDLYRVTTVTIYIRNGNIYADYKY